MIEHEYQIPKDVRNDAPLEVAGSSDVVPVQSIPTTPEQQYYRELLGGFFATLTRWQAILADDQYLLQKGRKHLFFPDGEGSTNGERRSFDVIATPEGSMIVPIRDSSRSSGQLEPDVILRVSSHVGVDIPEWNEYEKRFTITPGQAGRQQLVDLNGEPFNHIDIKVDKVKFVSYTQWLSILARTGKGTLAVDYNDNKQKVTRGESAVIGRGGMSDAYASHLFTTMNRLIPRTPVAPQQPR